MEEPQGRPYHLAARDRAPRDGRERLPLLLPGIHLSGLYQQTGHLPHARAVGRIWCKEEEIFIFAFIKLYYRLADATGLINSILTLARWVLLSLMMEMATVTLSKTETTTSPFSVGRDIEYSSGSKV